MLLPQQRHSQKGKGFCMVYFRKFKIAYHCTISYMLLYHCLWTVLGEYSTTKICKLCQNRVAPQIFLGGGNGLPHQSEIFWSFWSSEYFRCRTIILFLFMQIKSSCFLGISPDGLLLSKRAIDSYAFLILHGMGIFHFLIGPTANENLLAIKPIKLKSGW